MANTAVDPTTDELKLLERELKINKVYLPKMKGIQRRQVTAELWFAINPRVHERFIAPYGALLSVDINKQHDAKISHLFSYISPPMERDLVLQSADGINSFFLCGSGKNRLGIVTNEVQEELDLIDLACGVNGLVIQRDRRGAVRILDNRAIIINEGRRWWRKSSASTAEDDLRNRLPFLNRAPWASKRQTLSSLLNLALHVLSPSNIGATFLWMLRDLRNDEIQRPQLDLARLGLSVNERKHFPTIRHLLAQHDGATIVGLDGDVIATEVKLHGSSKASALISEFRGTRHTSAKRYSYDEGKSLVITVSEDGPVTVFSDGIMTDELWWLPSSAVVAIATERGNHAEAVSRTMDCARCNKLIEIHITYVDGGWDELLDVHCPVCRSQLDREKCFGISARIVKRI